jgi:AcrR family transcriptional regulator
MKKSGLTRENIARAALAIADTEGFHAVSMRRVAQELNVGTMSLYYYVKTKDDLVAVMDDALMGEMLLPSVPKNWRRAITEIATRTHSLFLRHPWALVSMLSSPPGANAMRHMELALLDDFVFGHALRESAHGAPIDLEFAKAQMATGAFPQLANVYRSGKTYLDNDRFKIALRMLLKDYPS